MGETSGGHGGCSLWGTGSTSEDSIAAVLLCNWYEFIATGY